jgi:hypothetical protein
MAGLGVGILLLVVCLCCVGGWWATSNSNAQKQATATAYTASYQATSTAIQTTYTTRLTPTPYLESQPPSGLDFSGTAQSIITNAQIASSTYDDAQPRTITSTFRPYQTIYVTYKLTAGYSGYIGALWYANGRSGPWSRLVNIQNRYGYGDFAINYNGEVQGAVELYWCSRSDCSDRQLAWVRTFQVKN